MDYVPFNAQEFHRWINDNGDGTLRIDYNLTDKDVVIDAGGYEGNWASTILQKYRPTIHVLEPVDSMYKNLEQKLGNYSEIHLHNVAIGGSTREMQISMEGDSSSLYAEGTNTQTVLCKDVAEFLEEQKIGKITLFKINIEGGEYELLERIIELNLASKVENFQIQFHRFIPHCKERREFIQQALSRTHTQTWNYEWIWENWTLKK